MKFIFLKLNHLKKRIIIFSSLLIVLSLVGILSSCINPSIKKPINFGMDFVGGNEIRISRECLNQCSPITSDELLSDL